MTTEPPPICDPAILAELEKFPRYSELGPESFAKILRIPESGADNERGLKRLNDRRSEAIGTALAHPVAFAHAKEMHNALVHEALGANSPFDESYFDGERGEMLRAIREVGASGCDRATMAWTAKELATTLNEARKVGAARDELMGSQFFTDEKGRLIEEEIEVSEAIKNLARDTGLPDGVSWIAENVDGKMVTRTIENPTAGDLCKGAISGAAECKSPEESLGFAVGFLVSNLTRRAIGKPYENSVSHEEAMRLQTTAVLAESLPATTRLAERDGAAATTEPVRHEPPEQPKPRPQTPNRSTDQDSPDQAVPSEGAEPMSDRRDSSSNQRPAKKSEHERESVGR